MDDSIRHLAPADDGYSRPIRELRAMFADDVLDRPDLYTGVCHEEGLGQLREVLAGRVETVTIYRATPDASPAVIHDGQWVTLSLDYARTHAMHPEDPEQDWSIWTTQAPADQIFTDGNDLNEFGFVGPSIPATIIQ